jgi:catalase
MNNTSKNTIKSRKIAFLAADGFEEESLINFKKIIEKEESKVSIIAPQLGRIISETGTELKVNETLLTTASVLFDAVFVCAGSKSVKTLLEEPNAVEFVDEAFKHCKPIAAQGDGVELFKASNRINKELSKETHSLSGILVDKSPEEFVSAIAQHRFWDREKKDKHLS